VSRRSAIALAIVVALIAPGAIAALAAGPPSSVASSLTANGRVIWNLDALLNDTFGNRPPCYDAEHVAIFSVAHGSDCPSPAARYQDYVFTFLNAFGSQFRLVSRSSAPSTGATTVPLRVNGDYVSCPDGQYHHGGPGWLVMGGGAGPNGEFWCS